jgi:hypothetical protein
MTLTKYLMVIPHYGMFGESSHFSVDFVHPSLGMTLKTFKTYSAANKFKRSLTDSKIKRLIEK